MNNILLFASVTFLCFAGCSQTTEPSTGFISLTTDSVNYKLVNDSITVVVTLNNFTSDSLFYQTTPKAPLYWIRNVTNSTIYLASTSPDPYYDDVLLSNQTLSDTLHLSVKAGSYLLTLGITKSSDKSKSVFISTSVFIVN